MSLTTLAYVATDLVALAVLVGCLYLPRHGRKDLVAAYLGVNVGVLAVTLLLSTATVGAGLGLGLFGVLSIIRLRSTEITQGEIAYFFAALALGLLGGIQTAPLAVVAALMALVLAALWIGDSPRLVARNRHQIIMLDRAIAQEPALRAHLEALLGGQVRALEVQRLDLVNDTTLVDVRYRLASAPTAAPSAPGAQAASAPTRTAPRPAAPYPTSPQAMVTAAPATPAASRAPVGAVPAHR